MHFETSCNEVAQRRFDRAMRYQHSFWYERQRKSSRKSPRPIRVRHGPLGRRAYLLNNPHLAIPAANLAPGLAAIEKAKAVGAKTERERDYIDALALMYVDHDKLNHRQRTERSWGRWRSLQQNIPRTTRRRSPTPSPSTRRRRPTDKTYAQQTKGAAILEPISRMPQHPGVTHYLIHLYDYPATAAKGLEAADRYAKIAPAAPHAQHMPSHIYTRVGYWKESIASNTRPRRRRGRKRPTTSSTDRTTWSMPICSSPKTRGARGHRRHGGDKTSTRSPSGRRVRARGFASAL